MKAGITFGTQYRLPSKWVAPDVGGARGRGESPSQLKPKEE
jgi:hypothetical protein